MPRAKPKSARKPTRNDWRCARTIFVADDDKVAQRYARDDDNSPYKFYFAQMLSKMKRGNRLYVFKSHKDQPDDEITLDYVMENCVTFGSVNKVVDEILKIHEIPATSASWFTPAWIGLIRRLQSARCS